VAAGAAALAATTAPAQEDHGNDLDFDSLLSTTTQVDEPHADRLETPELAADLPPLTAPTQPAPAAAKAEPVANLLDFDFDLDSFGKTSPPAAAAEPSPAEHADSRLMDFKLDDADAPPPVVDRLDDRPFTQPDPELPAAPMADQPRPVEFDLSGISLDLDSHADDSEALHDVPTLGEHAYSNTAEMATKLDLASAYQEIGDRDGARELLEEVIRGGDTEQSEIARGLLQKLA
jgi:pilus assembly protein FimV